MLVIVHNRYYGNQYTTAASRDVFLIPKISYIIRHCKFVSQSTYIFLKNTKKLKTTGSFQIGKKKPDEEKNYRWTEFFTSWTITSQKCTRAHVQENKSIYLSIYPPLKTGVYIYIYIYIDCTKENGLHMLIWILYWPDAFRLTPSSGV